MKLSLGGQFTWSAPKNKIFFAFSFASYLFFLLGRPFDFIFLPPLLTQVFFWDLLPTSLPLTNPSTSLMLPTPPPPLVLHSPSSLATLAFGFTCELGIGFSFKTFWDWTTWAWGARSCRNLTSNLRSTLKSVKLQEFHQPLQGKLLLFF